MSLEAISVVSSGVEILFSLISVPERLKSSNKSVNTRQRLFIKRNILRPDKGVVLILLEVSLILFSRIPQQDI